MKVVLSFLLLFMATISWSQSTEGVIFGTLIDAKHQSMPLAAANIMLKGTQRGVVTDFNGDYKITGVKPGEYTLVISYVGYETVSIPGVTVQSSDSTEVDAQLKPSTATLDAVMLEVETSRAKESVLLTEQKQSKIMLEAIGAQEMARKGVSNVAEAVTKISGVTKQDSRGVVVRGLGERYNFLTVNGLPIITGNPDKKIIPLDNFTTDIVRNINVYKTFQSDLYGDFAGASFNVVTKDIPTKPTTHIQLGVGANTQTTFQKFKIDAESSVEALGLSGGSRALPEAYDKSLIKLGYASTPEESKQLFDTDYNVDTYSAPVSSSLEITHGNTLTLNEEKKLSLGYYVGFNFSNDYQTRPSATLRSLNTQGGYNSNYEDVEDYTLSTKKSALLSLLLEQNKRFSLKLNNIFMQTTANFTREQLGYNAEANDDFFARTSRYRETLVNQTQLLGDWHLSKRSLLSFGSSYGFSTYDEPDRKLLYAEGKGTDAALFIANSSEPNRFYADLDINDVNAYLEYQLGLGEGTGYNKDKFAHNLTIGANFDQLSYDYFSRTIRLNIDPTAIPSTVGALKDIPLNTADPESFIHKGFNQGWLNYKDGSDASKFVEIDQTTAAAYLSYDLAVNDWDFAFGLRGEYFKRVIYYRKPTTGVYDSYLQSENENQFNIMPALNVKYALTENANLRFAASVTSTRPRVREILPIRYLAGPYALITGNPDLNNSTNYNFDLKYEFFPEEGGLFSITGFGKFIDAPIETIITPIAGGSSVGFANTEKAVVLGAEIEYQTDFEQLFGNAQLEPLKIGLNATVMYSQVTLDKTKTAQRFLTHDKRQLQGAAPFIINADISYDADFSKTWNSLFTVAFNTFGERIYAVGGANLNDTFEQPFSKLDFIWKNTLGDFTIDFEVENLLNSVVNVEQTPSAVNHAQPVSVLKYKPGMNFSLSIGYTF